MTVGGRIVSLILVGLVFVTTLCAQACFDPAPNSKCPMHQTNDCCKHEDSNAGRVTLATLNHHRITKVTIAWPAQAAQPSGTESSGIQLTLGAATDLTPSSQRTSRNPYPKLQTLRI